MEECAEIAEEIEKPMKTVNQEEIQEKVVQAGVEVEEGRKRKRGGGGGGGEEENEPVETKLMILYLMKHLK